MIQYRSAIHPLTRSLFPLPEESLPGFLLRLSHRLDASPYQLAVHTGLTRSGAATRTTHMIDIEPRIAAQFAKITRLEPADVHRMTLRSLRDHYPPLDTDRPAQWISYRDTRIFSAATRFCPDCLVGDSRSLQAEHGGAWSIRWRLPFVFACTVHSRLLEHLCPACDYPAHTRCPSWASILVPRQSKTLHPLQCRTPPGLPQKLERAAICEGRFDLPSGRKAPPAVAGLPALLALQRRFDALLQPGEPADCTPSSMGKPVNLTTYLADLMILSTLIIRSWAPQQSIETVHAAAAADLDDYVNPDSGRQARDELAERKLRPMPTRLPFDPAACASVLALATEILDTEPDDAQDLLRPLTARDESVTAQLAEQVDVEVHSSEIQAAFGLRVHHGGTRTTRQPEWGGRRPRFFHVPQVLPRAWCADDFTEAITMRTVTSEKIRSAAAVRLVQVLHDVDAWEAASLLENRAGERDLSDVRRILPRPVWDAFCDTVDRIATDLSSTTTPRNYQRLRRRMASWRLSETLAAQLLEGIRGGMACRDNARCRGWLHHYLEARIWTAATDGAFDAAPTMTNIDAKMRYYIAGRFHQHMVMPPKRGFATLIARVEDQARILASEFDKKTGPAVTASCI